MAIYDRDPTTGELTSLTGESNIKNLTPSATKELTTTATKAHSEGDYFNLNGKFVKAIDDIAIGDMLTEGTNIETTTVGAELTDINEDITTVGNTASSASTNATRALNIARSTSSFPTGDAYSTSSSYTVGDLVIYNNTLYKCKTACSSGSWSSNKSNFETTSLAGEITNLNSDLNELSYERTDLFGSVTSNTARSITVDLSKYRYIDINILYNNILFASRYTIVAMRGRQSQFRQYITGTEYYVSVGVNSDLSEITARISDTLVNTGGHAVLYASN